MTAAMVLALGCNDWTEDYDFAWHGEHVSVYGYGLSVGDACGGSFDVVDDRVESLSRALGVDDTSGNNYRWLSDEVWQEIEPCAVGFACTKHGEPISRLLPDEHELTHMVLERVGSDGCPSVLSEGLAEYFTGPNPRTWHPSAGGVEPLLSKSQIALDPRIYARATHFVSFLIEAYGIPGVVDLCRGLGATPTRGEWNRTVTQVLGLSLDELLAAYEIYPNCSSQQLRGRVWSCSVPPDFVFSSEDRLFHVHAGCEDPRTTDTAYGFLGNAVITRTVAFPQDTWVEIRLFTEGSSDVVPSFVSQECAACSADPQMLVDPWSEPFHMYRAGTHEVSVLFDREDAVDLYIAAMP